MSARARTLRAWLAAPVLVLALGAELARSVDFLAREVTERPLTERLRAARAPIGVKLTGALGSGVYALFCDVLVHVPEDALLVCVTSDFWKWAQPLVKLTGLVYPRWMRRAVTLPGFRLEDVRMPGGEALYLVDLESGFEIDWEASCERVVDGPGYTIWRLAEERR